MVRLQCFDCEGMENEYMFYYKGELHPLLSSHPDIQKAWKAWDDIIVLWNKISKSELPQNAENLHETEAFLTEDNRKSVVNRLAEPDSESVKNSTSSESRKETEYGQTPGDDDLR